ncbi:MAG: hypothetical protein HY400_06335 [Elusimicrobia bacterium]|nr:hypothetical protein [Elusimicrobiota bacterium]
MKNKKLHRLQSSVLILGMLVGSGCAPAARYVLRDETNFRTVKKIVLLPFFDANRLSVELQSESLLGPSAKFTRDFAHALQKSFSDRWEIVSGEVVEKELRALGSYTGYDKEAGRGQRTGFTLEEALKTGKNLRADAVLLGAATVADTKFFKKFFREAVSVRLLEVKSGKVLWGSSAYTKGIWGSSAISKIISKLREIQ